MLAPRNHVAQSPLRRRRWCKAPAWARRYGSPCSIRPKRRSIIAQVTIVDARGVEQTATVDERGVAVFENLAAGTYQVKASAESFRPLTTPFNVRRGENRTTLRLVLATIEQSVLVEDTERRRPPRQRLHANAVAGADRLAAGRSGRDGRGTGAHGRPGRADFRERLPRRPHAAEGSNPADPLSHQLVLGRVPRSRHDSRRGDHQARSRRLARSHQLRIPR